MRSCSKLLLRRKILLESTTLFFPSVPFHNSEFLPTPALKTSRRIIISSLRTDDKAWSGFEQNSSFVSSSASRVGVYTLMTVATVL